MLFSVIIPAFNAEKFILSSVNSVLTQNYQDFELIVVNDGSTDNTLKVLQSVNSPKLKIINQDNYGVSVARNKGILHAQGEFICFLDADDEYLENHLEVMKNLICKYSEYQFFVTKEMVRLIGGNIQKTVDTGVEKYYSNPILPLLKHEIKICTGVSAIRRVLFDKYGLFEPGVSHGEDTDMWRRLYVHTGFLYCDLTTFVRNRDGSMLTKTYMRDTTVDDLNRLDMFYSDDTIKDDVKDSLQILNECCKLSVVRTLILNGNKVGALKELLTLDRGKIPFLRYWGTFICIFVPSALIRFVVLKKNEHYYG